MPAKVTTILEIHVSGHHVPTFAVEGNTLVFDEANQARVMLLEGHITLPVGSTIELHDDKFPHHGTATVTGIRLLPGKEGSSPATLTLSVSVSEGWEKHYEVSEQSPKEQYREQEASDSNDHESLANELN